MNIKDISGKDVLAYALANKKFAVEIARLHPSHATEIAYHFPRKAVEIAKVILPDCTVQLVNTLHSLSESIRLQIINFLSAKGEIDAVIQILHGMGNRTEQGLGAISKLYRKIYIIQRFYEQLPPNDWRKTLVAEVCPAAFQL